MSKSDLELAADITIAALNSYSGTVSGGTGENIAKFFEAVYNKVKELSDKERNGQDID